MSAALYDQFNNVFSTAAGKACRCPRADVAATIAGIAPGAHLWTSSALVSSYPTLPDELAATGLSLGVDGDAEVVRDQPWGLTVARGAITESGSVILEERGLPQRTASLMTASLIVLCPMNLLYPSLDDAARILREIGANYGSYATLLSGPSRTADIERQLTIGVQGPGAVHVVFVE